MEGFVNRSITLMNMLENSVLSERNPSQFKKKLQEWVKKNIAAKPKRKFQVFQRRQVHSTQTPARS